MRRITMLLSSSALLAACATTTAPTTEAAPPSAVGERVGDFQLTDQHGKAHDLYYLADATAVTILATATGDPASAEAAAALESLSASYGEQGVELLMLNSVLDDDREDVAAQAAELGLTLPVL